MPPWDAELRTRASASGEIIVKAVNVSDRALPTKILLEGVKAVEPEAAAVVLTSAGPTDENTADSPNRVAPVTRTLKGASREFVHEFPAYSATVLRLKASAP